MGNVSILIKIDFINSSWFYISSEIDGSGTFRGSSRYHLMGGDLPPSLRSKPRFWPVVKAPHANRRGITCPGLEHG